MEEKTISAFIERELMRNRREKIHHEDNLIEQGIIDSLGIVKLLAHLEQSYGIHIADEELVPEHFETVGAIAALVRSKRTGSFLQPHV